MEGDDAGRQFHSDDRFADVLNRLCHCINVDAATLRQNLETRLASPGAYGRLRETHPHLLAELPVFISRGQVEQMKDIIRAIHGVLELDDYRDLVLGWAPQIARRSFGPRGVFFGYDFHLTTQGPQLIEINTNAGGALLILHLASAQQACCPEVEGFVAGGVDLSSLETEFVDMFRREFKLQFPGRKLHTIAIVDEKPAEQFLYPELALFVQVFRRHDIEALVLDPDELSFGDNGLCAKGRQIDLVYNRLTDFYFQSSRFAVLAEAYRENAAVFTPNPHTHALYANKQNLCALSDTELLAQWNLEASRIEILEKGIPRSELVTADKADELWSRRRQLFLKPVWGHGSKGTYRGAKLTRRTWQSILESNYIAQELVPPSERLLVVGGDQRSLKLDVRCYVYGGEVQLIGARMYRGQTTNLRTEGGGLASVFTTPSGTGSGVVPAVG